MRAEESRSSSISSTRVQKLGDIIQTAKDKIAGLFGGGSGEAIPGAEESEGLLEDNR